MYIKCIKNANISNDKYYYKNNTTENFRFSSLIFFKKKFYMLNINGIFSF